MNEESDSQLIGYLAHHEPFGAMLTAVFGFLWQS